MRVERREFAVDTCKYWIMVVMVITTGRRQKLELIIVARGLDFTVNYPPIVYRRDRGVELFVNLARLNSDRSLRNLPRSDGRQERISLGSVFFPPCL